MGAAPLQGEDDDVAAEVVFPNITPGTIVRGLRCRDGLTQANLASHMGISTRRLSEMENDKRPIDGETARNLAKIFQTTARMFLF